MKLKGILALVLTVALVFTLAACKPAGETFDIKVWVADAIVDLTRQQIEDFNNNNEYGIKFNATVEAVGEGDAATQMITDVEAGGDIFCFAQDQFARLVQANALSKLGTQAGEIVKTANDAGVVAAATAGGELYAYPLTSDNGYFMYYDKSVIPEEDLDSLEKLVADCEAAGKYFSMETDTSAWYIASFFFGTGCVSEWETDADGNFISVHDTFNSPEGLIAVKGMKKLVDSPMYLSSSDGAGFDSGCAIVVTGTWAYETVSGILGDNLGATDLPSFEVDGTEYHMGSFNGCKLMGVKPQTDAEKSAAVHRLAQYLTGEQAQLERFKAVGWGPANLNDQANAEVQASPALSALLQQNQYSVPQGQIHGSWWDIAKVIGTDVENATDEAGLQAALDNYYASISSLFTMSEDEKTAWGVIGAICGTNWDTDFPMTELDDGTFASEELELYKGDEFKVRQGKSWDVNFGSDGNLNGPNCVVEASGKYIVHLAIAEDGTTAEITLELLEELPDPEPSEGGEETPAVEGWSVIGALCDTNWDTDFPMTEQEDGTWKSTPLELKADDELKCRKDGDWAENMGTDGPDGANLKVEADGIFVVVLDLEAGTITLEPATWGVVGSMTGWGETPDYPMTEAGGSFVSDPIELKAGDELKVRAGSDWTINYGTDGRDGANLKVEADGTYTVILDLVEGTIAIQPAE